MKTLIAIAAVITLGVSAYTFAGSSETFDTMFTAGSCCGGQQAVTDEKVKIVYEGKEQTICPIMGNTLSSKNLYVDYKGKRIYVCCPPCVNAVKKDPEAAIKKIEQNGETVGIIKK